MTEQPKSANEVLAEILLRQEMEKAAEKKAVAEQKAKLAAQRRETEHDSAQKRLNVIKWCDHLMGNHRRGRETPHREIPDLSLHTFASGKSIIRCNRCDFIWKPRDTRKTIVRDGKKQANPTCGGLYPEGWSWEDARKATIKGGPIGNQPGRAFTFQPLEREEFKD